MGSQGTRKRSHRDQTGWYIIDTWVRDRSVRRDGLVALAMLLAASVIIAAVAAIGIVPILQAPATHYIASGLTTGYVGWFGGKAVRRRLRARHVVADAVHVPHARQPEEAAAPAAADDGREPADTI